MTDIFFIVENGYNTSYIDSLFMTLFYRSSCIETLLNYNADDSRFYYIQTMIKNNLINATRRNYSVGSEILNEIRNYCVMCGFNQNDITCLYDIAEFYSFFLNGVGTGKIQVETINVNNYKDITQKTFNYIEFMPTENDTLLDTNAIIERWTNESLIEKKYHFVDIPFLIPIHVNRNIYGNKINTCSVDIMKKIKFSTSDDSNQKNMSWQIHGVICYSKTTQQYYSLIQLISGDWYMYDSTQKPSIYKIENMKKDDFNFKIKEECVFILYRLDSYL